MQILAYRGFRPTSRYIGIVWLGKTVFGVEVSSDAVGLVVWDTWMGVIHGKE